MQRSSLATALAAVLLCGSCATSALATDIKLPRTMVWSSYQLGGSGYAEASGMANALQTKYGTRIRIVPAGTSIGRLLPITLGKVDYGFLANEVYFATEALYDFSVQEWGPQDLRIVLARPASNGMACAGDAGITDIKSLKGKRIGFVKANPSVNVKTDGVLAFGGLTRADVEVVMFGSYTALKDAILADQLDCMISVTTSSNMRQIEASPRKIYWPEFPVENREGWKRMLKVMSFVAPFTESIGAGLSKEKPRRIYSYRFPMITTYASRSADEVYNLIKALDATFKLYNQTTGSSVNWAIERSILPPADAPWHEGAIRYAKDKGLWTKEAQAWQDERLARFKKVQKAWDEAVESFTNMRIAKRKEGVKISAQKAWPAYWQAYREKHL